MTRDDLGCLGMTGMTRDDKGMTRDDWDDEGMTRDDWDD